MQDIKAKQQIVEKIKAATNILVTVSTDPSVDELSAALGLTLLLNKLNKHATAVVSGEVPAAINFLDPNATFERTTDSLRDFIIALDKEKADHLRYKVEGDVVKVFITPYRTTITSEDLDFSQGDYNVDLVIALGVENRDHLDTALANHGKILHDAAVVTLSAGEQASRLGSIDWRDENASSLSEMLVSLSESLKSDTPILDATIASALLTGIVAATERFSNPRTSSRVMTMAAQLMAAGADQQLIAAKLEEAQAVEAQVEAVDPESELDLKKEKTESKKKVEEAPVEEPKPPKPRDGELVINHEKTGDLDAVAKEVHDENQQAAAAAASEALKEAQAEQGTSAAGETPVAPEEIRSPEPIQEPTPSPVAPHGAVEWTSSSDQAMTAEPSMGGTLNATTEEAEDAARKQSEQDKNRTILTHGNIDRAEKPTYDTPLNGSIAPAQEASQSLDIFAGDSSAAVVPPKYDDQPVSTVAHDVQPLDPFVVPEPLPNESQAQPFPPIQPQQQQMPAPMATLADLDAQNRATSVEPSHEDARAAVEAALAGQAAPAGPVLPDLQSMPLPPPLPDFSTLPPPPILDPASGGPERLGDIFATDSLPAPQALPPAPADPGQFKIPGQ